MFPQTSFKDKNILDKDIPTIRSKYTNKINNFPPCSSSPFKGQPVKILTTQHVLDPYFASLLCDTRRSATSNKLKIIIWIINKPSSLFRWGKKKSAVEIFEKQLSHINNFSGLPGAVRTMEMPTKDKYFADKFRV